MAKHRIVRDDEPTGERPKSRRDHIPPPPHRNGRGPRRFSYTYEDMARLFGVKVATVQHWVWQKRFDPEDLQDVVRVANERQRQKEHTR